MGNCLLVSDVIDTVVCCNTHIDDWGFEAILQGREREREVYRCLGTILCISWGPDVRYLWNPPSSQVLLAQSTIYLPTYMFYHSSFLRYVLSPLPYSVTYPFILTPLLLKLPSPALFPLKLLES